MRSDTESCLVLGLGSSGIAAAKLLRGQGYEVTAIDGAAGDALQASAAELDALGVEVVLGADSMPGRSYGLCVVSPGVPASSEWIAAARAGGSRIVSELELGYQACSVPIIAVTGTNGKSTLTKLCAAGLMEMGLRADMAGNYGTPLTASVVDQGKLDWLVVEVSSFQLEWVESFCPRTGILLNLQADHLDRHGDMERYGRTKARIFGPAGSRCGGVVHEPLLQDVTRWRGQAQRWTTFGSHASADLRCMPGGIVDQRHGRDGACYSIEGTAFDNPVMALTAAAGLAAFIDTGLDADALARAIRVFEPLEHRMTLVTEVGGVRFVDDSKATNLAALRAGIEMTPGRVRLIAGGRLKETDLDCVKELLANRVDKVYVIGEAAEGMEQAWHGATVVCNCGDLQRAVEMAVSEAAAGDTVLLSPGCASFDQFESYKERGDRFAALVKELKEETVSL